MTGLPPGDDDLTEAQRLLVDLPGSRFVEACPGAGKTKAIVARYLRIVDAYPRHGVALLSFTNAAVDEIASRAFADAFRVPNFVGTFDAFINRYITGPFYAQQGSYPHFVDSWDSIPGTAIRIAGMEPYLQYPLEWFDRDAHAHLRLDPPRVVGRYRAQLNAAYSKWSEEIDQQATRVHDDLTKNRRTLSSSASRSYALDVLDKPESRGVVGALLSARFAEVIVDETQDCGIEELQILKLLLDFGCSIVAVADLDQAIFEFRRASPGRVREFAGNLPQGTRLGGNFRSTPAICEINKRLRASDEEDEACGVHGDSDRGVSIVIFEDPAEVPTAVEDVVFAAHLDLSDVMVLAHRRTDARACAGAPGIEGTSRRKILFIAQANLVLRHQQDPALRRQAISSVERTLVEVLDGPVSNRLSTAVLAQEMGIDVRWLRDASMRVALSTDAEGDRKDYARRIRATVEGLDWPGHIKMSKVSNRLAAPLQEDWAQLTLADPSRGIRWNTVHGAKGRQYEAVVLVIPKNLRVDESGRTCLDLWEQGVDGESRRVLYVGASRARQLLVLAVHCNHEERVRRLAPRRAH